MNRVKKIARILPVFLTILGSLLITILAAIHFTRYSSLSNWFLEWTMLTVYMVWKFWEIKISLRELKLTKTNHDQSTMELCAAVEILLLVSIFLSHTRIIKPMLLIGGLLFIIGLWLRIQAIRTLGDQYCVRIREINSFVVQSGPYALIRHPSYLGTILIHCGMVTLGLSWFSLSGLIAWWIVVAYRAKVEDQWLSQFARYQQYTAKVRWKLVPFIW